MNVLKNKQYKSYDRLSRYSNIPFYYNTHTKQNVYGTAKHLNNNTSYILHVVKKNDTYDSLALDYYNNPTYFWIICDFNRILDPFKSPLVGDVLYIPVISDIEFE